MRRPESSERIGGRRAGRCTGAVGSGGWLWEGVDWIVETGVADGGRGELGFSFGPRWTFADKGALG